MTTVYVPRDSSARSVGADQVAAAIELEAARLGALVEVVRNGSLGMMWLEPLVEVVSAQGRVAYGPVTPDDVAGLFAAGFLDGDSHELGQGPTDQIPWLADQDRLTFSRVGVIDPLSTQDYQAHGGLFALRRALTMTPQQIGDEGDSGTFADRMLMEGDPFMLIEGMVIAGIAADAHEGFIYIRSEYPDAVATMRAAIETAYQVGWLGSRILGS